MTDFQEWLEETRPGSSIEQRVELAKRLFDESIEVPLQEDESIGAIAERLQNSQVDLNSIVSWKGISVNWFLDYFCKTPYAKRWTEFGCQVWFVRNYCTTEILRRSNVASGPLLNQLSGNVLDLPGLTVREDDGKMRPIVSGATVFLSYTGRYTFEHFVDLLSDLRGEYIWTDIFCVDQFAWNNQSGNPDEVKIFRRSFMVQLQERIGQIPRTALLLEEWHSTMAILRQSWVLWEVFSAIEAGTDLSILIPSSEIARFHQILETGGEGLRQTRLSLDSIDVRAATADNPLDRGLILELMEEQGIHEVNCNLSAQMRQWFLEQGRKYVESRRLSNNPTQESLISVAILLIDQDLKVEAKQILEESIEVGNRRTPNGTVLALTVQTQLLMGASEHEYDKQEAIFRSALAVSEEAFGSDHILTLCCRANFGGFIKDKSEAEAFLMETLDAQRRSPGMGDGCAETITTMLNLAALSASQCKLAETQSLFEEALYAARSHLGKNHPLTLRCTRLFANWQYHKEWGTRKKEEHLSFPSCEQMAREAFEASKQRHGSGHPETQNAMLLLASSLAKKKQFVESEQLVQKALERSRATHGPRHDETLNRMNQTANILSEGGKHEEAILLYRRILAMRQQASGSNRLYILSAMNNLGCELFIKVHKSRLAESAVVNILSSKTGSRNEPLLEEAEGLFRQVVDGRRSLLGRNHAQTFRAVENLGNVLQQQDRFDEAAPLFEEALGASSPILTEVKHLSQLVENADQQGNVVAVIDIPLRHPLHHEASECLHQGNFTRSMELYQGVISELSDDNLEKYDAMHGLAYALFRSDDMEASETYYRKAWMGKDRILGCRNPNTVDAMVQLATQMLEQHKVEAEPLFREALEHMKGADGNERPSRWSECICNLASVLSMKGELYEAECLYQEVLGDFRELSGDTDPDSLLYTCLHQLALLRLKQDRVREAKDLFQEALDGRRKILGREHPETIKTMRKMVSLLEGESAFDKATTLQREIVFGTKNQFGMNSTKTVSAMDKLGDLLSRQSKWEELEALSHEAIAAKRVVYGENHFEVTIALFNLGAACRNQGKISRVERLYRQVLADTSKRESGDHEHIAFVEKECVEFLKILLKTLGKTDELDTLVAEHGRFLE